MTGASASVIGWAVAMSTAGLDKGAPRVKVLQVRTPRTVGASAVEERRRRIVPCPWRTPKGRSVYGRQFSDFSEVRKGDPANVENYDGDSRECANWLRKLPRRSIEGLKSLCEGLFRLNFTQRKNVSRFPTFDDVDEMHKVLLSRMKPPHADKQYGTRQQVPGNSPETHPMTRVAVAISAYSGQEGWGGGNDKYNISEMTQKDDTRYGRDTEAYTSNEMCPMRQLIDKIGQGEAVGSPGVRTSREGKINKGGGKKDALETKADTSIWLLPVRQKKRGQAQMSRFIRPFGGAMGRLAMAWTSCTLNKTQNLDGSCRVPGKRQKLVYQLPHRDNEEVQSLNWEVSRLNRFLSKSAEKSVPCSKQSRSARRRETSVGTTEAEKLSRAQSNISSTSYGFQSLPPTGRELNYVFIRDATGQLVPCGGRMEKKLILGGMIKEDTGGFSHRITGKKPSGLPTERSKTLSTWILFRLMVRHAWMGQAQGLYSLTGRNGIYLALRFEFTDSRTTRRIVRSLIAGYALQSNGCK
ncbi:hypothetical protein Tco_0651959 [Tanacetum coccineum]|uniref:Uncharacterized protein n=1 Tax=Tanacetum coccineum TaxID=301880 RepID=A0ABQ4WWU3_9ASTR